MAQNQSRPRLKKGTIEVYFDDMTKPHMSVVDKTYGKGRIGIGSFDDMNDFDNIKLGAGKTTVKRILLAFTILFLTGTAGQNPSAQTSSTSSSTTSRRLTSSFTIRKAS